MTPPIVVPWPIDVRTVLLIDLGLPTSDPLRRRVYNNVRTMVNWPNEVATGTKSVVNNNWHASLMCDRNNLLKVGDVVFRVADALDLVGLSATAPLKTNAGTHVDGLCLVIDGSLKVLGLVAIDELGLDPQAWEEDLELIVCASVQVRGRNDVVPSVS
jgi:hypothetical protein